MNKYWIFKLPESGVTIKKNSIDHLIKEGKFFKKYFKAKFHSEVKTKYNIQKDSKQTNIWHKCYVIIANVLRYSV